MSTAPADLDAALAQIADALARGAAAEARAACAISYGLLAHASDPANMSGALARFEARAALLEGDGQAALDSLTFALAVAELAHDEDNAAHALHYSANVHLHRGELDDAVRLHEAARARARAAGNRRTIASATLALGIVANVRGDFGRARSQYRRALTAWRRLGAMTEAAHTLNNLGQLYADLGQWLDAEVAYNEGIAIVERLGADNALAHLQTNLVEVWIGRGDLTRARRACEQARVTCERTPHGASRGELHKMSGVIARESGMLVEADAELAAAERIASERHDLLLLAEVAREQGDLYRRQGRNRDTLAALNRSHTLFRQLRAQRDLADVARRMGRLESEFLEVARRWGESIEAKDRYTQGHCQRVADLSCMIAEHAGAEHGFDAQTMFWYRIGALLHDVGKLDLPAEVLNKPGKLSDAEWAMMRGHAEAGVALLGDIEFPWDIRPIVLSHHERWDGRGYPHGLAGEAIPLAARVLAVADVYDALTSVRSYKRAMTHEDAMRIMRQDAGTAFDPQVVAWFEAVAPAWRAGLAAAERPQTADTPRETDARAERRAAGLDEVTGLPGRRAFFEECERVLSARVEGGRPTTLLLITLSPPAGAGAVSEATLFAVGEGISRNTRGGDFVGRYAEREFVVVLPDTGPDEGAATLGRLRDVVGAALQRVADGGAPGAAEFAMGAAPESGTSAGALLAAADAGLRRARGGARSIARRELQAV